MNTTCGLYLSCHLNTWNSKEYVVGLHKVDLTLPCTMALSTKIYLPCIMFTTVHMEHACDTYKQSMMLFIAVVKVSAAESKL